MDYKKVNQSGGSGTANLLPETLKYCCFFFHLLFFKTKARSFCFSFWSVSVSLRSTLQCLKSFKCSCQDLNLRWYSLVRLPVPRAAAVAATRLLYLLLAWLWERGGTNLLWDMDTWNYLVDHSQYVLFSCTVPLKSIYRFAKFYRVVTLISSPILVRFRQKNSPWLSSSTNTNLGLRNIWLCQPENKQKNQQQNLIFALLWMTGAVTFSHRQKYCLHRLGQDLSPS